MNMLVMDTSSDKLLLAVLKGEKIFTANNEGKYMETLLPAIDKLFKESGLSLEQLDTIGVVVGPGSFTGVRIGVSTVKGFIFAHSNIKVAAVNALELLAYTTMAKQAKDTVTAVIPSTASKLYIGRFKKGGEPKYSLENTHGFSDLNSTTEQHYDLDVENKVEVDESDLIAFCQHLVKEERFGELNPYYLALSQAEENLLKKEGGDA